VSQLIVALDVPSADEAERLIDALYELDVIFKIGMESLYGYPERIFAYCEARDVRFFVDAKLHDIPRTVGAAIRQLVRPGAHIVILTTFDDTELIHAGLRAGALGYSLKDITAEELAMTVRTAARGQVLLQPDIASKVFSALTPAGSPALPTSSKAQASLPRAPSPSSPYMDATIYIEQLTEREREILMLVARGASNREIAEKLYLTEGTVKNHMSNILSKLGVRDRTQAGSRAKELGLA